MGSTVIGGYVYRGSAITGLAGSYVFGDFGEGTLFRLASAQPPLEVLLDTAQRISSFAEDTASELYVLDIVDGTIFKIVPAP